MSNIILPPSLAGYQTKAGHRRGINALGWGEAGGGKSIFAASFPSPKCVVIPGEPGILPYLDDEVDTVIDAQTPDVLTKAIEFAIENPNHFASLIVDPITLGWEDWMDYYSEQFGGDIRGGQWNEVKTPWKVLTRRVMHSSLNVCFTAWVSDIIYSQEETMPGVKGKLEIKQQEIPKVEKRIPHIFDLAIQFSIERDKLNRPTQYHIARVTKARRPKGVAPEDLHVGKTWRFDEVNPTDPWKAIVAPILEQWQGDGAVECIGMDPRKANADMQDLEETYQDATVGEVTRKMQQAAVEGKSLEEYREIFESVRAAVSELTEERQAQVMKVHDEVKGKLEGGK